MIARTERQKRYMMSQGVPGYNIRVLPEKDVGVYLVRQLERMPRIGPQQMEIDFGEGFNFWWYDHEDVLHPNDSDYSIHKFPEPEEFPDDWYDDDMPF